MGVGISNFKRKSEIDQVIFKLPYFNPLFQETEILLDWQFSNTILVTAFDLFRNDGLVTKLQKTGSSLKDYLHDFGFNKKIKILADTGVFELEMRKARLSKFDKYITKLDTLKTEEIFHAYNLIDPDFLVAPDEMILVNDTTQDQELKKQIILDNLQKTLSEFPRTKVIATIQGLDQKVISEITDDIREEKITKVARGGLLPLRKHSRTQFSSILTLTEKIARKANMKHLHAFGLSNINVLRDYFVHNSYNSVDTSAVYYYTVDRKYLTKKNKFVQVRKANFDLCDCAGCEIMKDNLFFADRNTKFIIGLYSHNAHQTAKMAFALQNKPSLKVEAPKINFTKSKKWKKKARLEWPGQGLVNDEFISVLELSKLRKKQFDDLDLHTGRLSKINHSNQREFTANNVKILVISSCSKRKAEYSDLSFNDLDSTKKRKRILKSKKRKKYKAVDLYQGYQNREINSAIDELRQDLEVDQLILSAGWGLLEENDLIVSYDASFQSKSDEEIDSLAQRLEIQSDFKKFIKNKEYSLIYIALGPPYMRALGDLDFLQKNADEVVIFCSVEEMDTNLSSRISYFSLEEFWKLEKQNTSVIKSPFYLGKRYQARGSIFRNFVYYLCNYRSPSLSFISWWHLLYDCGCQKEKLS